MKLGMLVGGLSDWSLQSMSKTYLPFSAISTIFYYLYCSVLRSLLFFEDLFFNVILLWKTVDLLTQCVYLHFIELLFIFLEQPAILRTRKKFRSFKKNVKGRSYWGFHSKLPLRSKL